MNITNFFFFFLFVKFISFLQKHKNTKYIYKYNITQKFMKLKEERIMYI